MEENVANSLEQTTQKADRKEKTKQISAYVTMAGTETDPRNTNL